MGEAVRNQLRERISRGASIDEIETIIGLSRGLTENERESLWAFAWGYSPDPKRSGQIAAARAMMRRRPQPLH